MDDEAGVEKLWLIVSPSPIDFSNQFDLRTGGSRSTRSAGFPRMPRQDTVAAVIARLHLRASQIVKELPAPRPPKGISLNAMLVNIAATCHQKRYHSAPTRGIDDEGEMIVATSMDEERPILVELTLLHYAS